MEFVKELKKLGLKDKEAAVYLACLELGPSPVQQVSRKARVVRATTYVILESLMHMGLVTKFKEGKKTLFSAEPPRQLKRLLEKQKEELGEKEYHLDDVLPELQMIMKSGEGKPSVRYFEGIEGLNAIRREMLMYSKPDDTWYNFTPIDYLDSVLQKEQDSYYKQRNAKRIKSKTIFLSKSPTVKKQILSAYENKLIEQRYLSADKSPVTSGLTVYRDRIAIGSFAGRLGGVVIESEPMANMMRRLFELAWMAAETIDE
ncbi:MAG: helix-turn-helix domain-containing protein [Candidatus Andersenbacteria bacterium]